MMGLLSSAAIWVRSGSAGTRQHSDSEARITLPEVGRVRFDRPAGSSGRNGGICRFALVLAPDARFDPEDRELFWFAETATEIWNGIRHWYDVFGAKIAPMP